MRSVNVQIIGSHGIMLQKNEKGDEGMEFENREAPSRPGKHFSRLGWIYFAGSVAIFLVQYVVFLVIQTVAPQILYHYDTALILSSASMYLLAFPVTIGLAQKLPSVRIPQKKMSMGKWITAFFMSYALMYIMNLAGVFLTSVLGIVIGNPVKNPFGDAAVDMSLPTAILLVVLCAPVVEEYVFRKIIIDRSIRYGEKTAIVLSGVMFALFHGNLNQFVYALGLGMFFGFIYVKTGKLVYTIVLHALVNFMGAVPGLLLLKTDLFGQLENLSGNTGEVLRIMENHSLEVMLYLLYLICMLVFVMIGIVFWALHVKKMKCHPGEVQIPEGKRFRTVVFNAGMGMYFLFWIVQIVLQLFE